MTSLDRIRERLTKMRDDARLYEQDPDYRGSESGVLDTALSLLAVIAETPARSGEEAILRADLERAIRRQRACGKQSCGHISCHDSDYMLELFQRLDALAETPASDATCEICGHIITHHTTGGCCDCLCREFVRRRSPLEAARLFAAGDISAGKLGELLGLQPGELHQFKTACHAFCEADSARDHLRPRLPERPSPRRTRSRAR